MLDQGHNDDIWAESDEEHRDYEKNLAEKEWDRLQDDHGNVSYQQKKKRVVTHPIKVRI